MLNGFRAMQKTKNYFIYRLLIRLYSINKKIEFFLLLRLIQNRNKDKDKDKY